MAGTFSSQLAQQKAQQEQSRTTRTQRVLATQQEQGARNRFNALQNEANRLRNTEFSNISFEEYKSKYAQLSSDLQQFFLSPTEVLTKQDQEKELQRQKMANRIKEAEADVVRQQNYIKDHQKQRGWTGQNKAEVQLAYREAYLGYLRQNASKIDEGFLESQIQDYASEKASFDRDRWEGNLARGEQFTRQLNAGELDSNIAKLGLVKFGLTYDEYAQKVTTYNQDVGYQNQWNQYQYDKYTKQIELENAKQQANIKSAQEIIAKSGFAVGVSLEKPKDNTWQNIWSKIKALALASPLGGTIDVNEKEQEKLLDLRYQRTRESVTLNSDIINKINQEFYKTGTGYFNPATQQYENKKVEIGQWQDNFLVAPPVANFYTLPYSKAYSVIENQEQLDYKAEQTTKLLDDLDKIANTVSPEMKPYIETEGLKILQQKGLQTKTEYIIKADEYGGTSETSTISITDPAFERKISQNLLEWEQSRLEHPIPQKDINVEFYKTGTGYFNPATQQYENKKVKVGEYTDYSEMSLRQVGIATKIIGLEYIETRALLKGVKFGVKTAFKGANLVYTSLGGGLKYEQMWVTGTTSGKALVSSSSFLPEVLTTKTVTLAEGTAVFPRQFKITKTALALGLSGLYGFGKYKQYQSYKATSKFGTEVFWLETLGELGGIESETHIVKDTYYKTMNKVYNWNLEMKAQPDISQEGFMRMNKRLGFQERVYMTRAKGNELIVSGRVDAKNYNLFKLGMGDFTAKSNKGTFLQWQKKLISDEVLAYYKYGGDITVTRAGKVVKAIRGETIWELQKSSKFGTNIFKNRGEYIWRGRKIATGRFSEAKLIRFTEKLKELKSIKATPFPIDKKSTHIKWFLKKNIQEFGVGTYSKLPINVKGKAMGISASGEEWIGTDFEKNIIYYIEKGKIKSLKVKGAIQFVSGKGTSAGFLRIFSKGTEEGIGKSATSPIIYVDYFDKIKVNKAIKEIKGLDSAGRELKMYIYPRDTGATGTLNIPLNKLEVEGTVEIRKRIPIRRTGIWLEGWKVPVEEQIFTDKSQLSAKEIKGITKSIGGIFEQEGKSVSSLPSKSPVNRAIYSILGYSKPSKSKSFSSIISRISGYSRPSRISEISKIGGSSRSSRISRISEMVRSSMDISRVSSASSSSRTPSKSRISRISLMDTELKSKIKRRLKQRKTPEIVGLMPDFTARALGLAPKRVKSVKEALKEMNKIQSGFEIRTGATFKPNKLIRNFRI